MRSFRRHKNRNLYDLDVGRIVTTNDVLLASLVSNVNVIDDTGKDLTDYYLQKAFRKQPFTAEQIQIMMRALGRHIQEKRYEDT